MSKENVAATQTLKKALNLPMMVLYGLGTTIGAGIYALVGELAGIAGYYAPISFLLASVLAGFTAMSFAELSGRYPRAAGAALYVQKGFASTRLSTIVGLLVFAAGIVSSAALMNAFIGYFHEFFQLDRKVIIVALCLVLGGLAIWGIIQSVLVASIITLIEIGGLVLVIYTGTSGLNDLPQRLPELVPELSLTAWGGILAGSVLAFYAFIGFEDMVDVAEEVKQVKKTLPYAILITLIVTTFLYLLVMLVSVLAMPPEQLAKSKAPLSLIYTHYSGNSATVISVIGLFAIINGALIQIIMGSRVLYGLSSRKQLPAVFSKINSTTKTPVVATLMAVGLVLIIALYGRLSGLAKSASIIMLSVFTIVNFSLLLVKRRQPKPQESISFPFWVPLLGFVTSFAYVIMEIVRLIIG